MSRDKEPINVTGVVWDHRYLEHKTGDHPESARRLTPLYTWLEEVEPDHLIRIRPRKASPEQVKLVHSADYVTYVEEFCRAGGGYIWLDTAVCTESFDVALWAVGGLLEAVDAVIQGRTETTLALVRPPGHHAESGQAMGFCLFNNVAVAARYLQEKHGMERILILDWDVHHGNGTENCFLHEDSVLYFSIHQSPAYPGTGPTEEVGRGAGAGYNINVPLPPGCGDETYITAFEELLWPVVRQYRPEFVLVSAGMDAHFADPLSGMRVTSPGFGYMAQRTLEMAREFSQGRLVLSLEGGYDPQATWESVKAITSSLAGLGAGGEVSYDDVPDYARAALDRAIRAQEKYWRVLSPDG